jgi:hypothetical protein
MRGRRIVLSIGALAPVAAAQAHPFAPSYTLPVPFWMYAAGTVAALLLSFLAVGWWTRAGDERAARAVGDAHLARLLLGPRAVEGLAMVSVLGLLLCIATGLLGTRSAAFNLNMTLFWIVFVLGVTYLSALVGNLFDAINPWHRIVRAIERTGWLRFDGRASAGALGDAPALALYAGFIVLELFGRAGPRGLGALLLGYTVLNVVAAWYWGARAWFSRGEFFSVLFARVSLVAPLQLHAAIQGPARVERVAPCAPLDGRRAGSNLEVLFVLFMLSSTAFDGLHATQGWAKLFWEDFAALLAPWIGDNIVQTYPLLSRLYLGWQILALLLSPLVYLGLYLLCLAAMRRLTGCRLALPELARRFAYAFIPIALVYHAAHYATLLVTQGLMIVRLASDPFGVGWNLFGTALWLHRPVIPDMDAVWHTQVGLILLGHVASVVAAHREALRLFDGRRGPAMRSQLPMLALMLAFTAFGLWILAQPITAQPA